MPVRERLTTAPPRLRMSSVMLRVAVPVVSPAAMVTSPATEMRSASSEVTVKVRPPVGAGALSSKSRVALPALSSTRRKPL